MCLNIHQTITGNYWNLMLLVIYSMAGILMIELVSNIGSRSIISSLMFSTSDMNQEIGVNANSSMVPLRGIGDSFLPFQAKYAEEMDGRLDDLFKEMPLRTNASILDYDNPPLKKILYWNDAYRYKHFGIGFGREPFLRAKCPVNTCFATSDRNRFPIEEVDAVMWHLRASNLSLPIIRSPHTRYVVWMTESASYLFANMSKIRYTFNWTYTYRRDSDFVYRYGIVYRSRTLVQLPDYKKVTMGKTKMAAWLVSNCYTRSGREKYVNLLKQHIKVDIFGHCGSLKCEKKYMETCREMVERDYKFYLSFENSLCMDYITEKFYRMLQRNVVPVVYGLGDYAAIAPPHSYINAQDFSSAKDLATYLKYLDKNDTAYMEYFQWKAYHQFSDDRPRTMMPACELCARLHTDEKKVTDLYEWFVQESHCQSTLDGVKNYWKGRAVL